MTNPRTAPPTLTDLTTYLLSKTGKAARTRLTTRLAARGLRLWHMAVLAALADFGPHAQRELADRLAIDPSDVVKILDELGSAGYVERSRDTTDRRRFSVTLTPSGLALLATLTTEAEEVQDEILAPLTPAERTQLHTLLSRLTPHA
ncbi:MarR family transcriptional regulator [Kitasatospora sp. MMS16-BH015]|uniref:MarR family winged helix-turn-helix transcriptional regulator n=1 Tax=Kitasatospora sp. MMS16-BH015 TaxID=2018025 RepID=UPI000CA203C2|nr:MarR family winged helix-turn-helix transcriptional regulator [Kitasatospora sp. MMS16-BH015]AUG81454.1 MarR family transcriptional regulator [Kitasatospora sp. MMS16-BH015]